MRLTAVLRLATVPATVIAAVTAAIALDHAFRPINPSPRLRVTSDRSALTHSATKWDCGPRPS